jgi:hypothetical protein
LLIHPLHTQTYTYLKIQDAVCSKWKVSTEMKGEEGKRRTLGFSKHASHVKTFASSHLYSATLPSQISVLKGKSNPEASGDSDVKKKIYSRATKSSFFSCCPYFLRS